MGREERRRKGKEERRRGLAERRGKEGIRKLMKYRRAAQTGQYSIRCKPFSFPRQQISLYTSLRILLYLFFSLLPLIPSYSHLLSPFFHPSTRSLPSVIFIFRALVAGKSFGFVENERPLAGSKIRRFEESVAEHGGCTIYETQIVRG